jgi:hypothetical protein
MSKAIAPIGIAILAVLALTAMPSASLAQAGSTGGTVGKQDKSVSGGSGSAVAPLKKNIAPSEASQSPIKSSCRNVVGEWKWYLGLTVTTFSADGALKNSSGAATGTWMCTGAAISGIWTNGAKEHYTLSPDGNSLLVNSSWGGGITFAATRESH